MKSLIFLLLALAPLLSCHTLRTSVLVVGGGTGGTAAGIQSARTGAKTVLAEPSAWLGGMLTAQGVSATDGNHAMPAGIWGEFRSRLRAHYGSPEALLTGWVSETQFEPHVGARVFAEMAAAEPLLDVRLNTRFFSLEKRRKGWLVRLEQGGKHLRVRCRILVDGTDLGDVAAAAGCAYDLGMDARSTTGEAMAPAEANDIVQDFTFCATLKDYGEGKDMTLPRPANYDPAEFRCCCQTHCTTGEKTHPCETMLSYARLPGNKYLINWPLRGNDFYANVVELPEPERLAAYEQAKQKTLRFIYYMQTELGWRHLSLADDEYPTPDRLPFSPYHREGRRIRGLAQLNVNHLLRPQATPLTRTGIAVGDYPIDHHHKELPTAPGIDFPPVPSFSIPAGCLVPQNVPNFLVADKAISVTNVVNGASRLQPVILQVGQAAGLMAALSAQQKISPNQLNVREVQDSVLAYRGYLMPYYDVPPEHPQFEAIQQVGASGILWGIGEPYQWANRTWFYPDSLLRTQDLIWGLETIDSTFEMKFSGSPNLPGIYLSLQQLLDVLNQYHQHRGNRVGYGVAFFRQRLRQLGLDATDLSRPVVRKEAAAIWANLVLPYDLEGLDFQGAFRNMQPGAARN